MPTKKKTGARGGKKTQAPRHSDTYEQALEQYGNAVELLRKEEVAKALELFETIIKEHGDEPELVDRARIYRDVCGRRLAGEQSEPDDAPARYHRAVVMMNEGHIDEAIGLLGKLLATQPEDASALYARASALALQGRLEQAVTDLRKAVSIEPTLRFQAANDPDFDRIRDDAAFIDVIEPTPTGA